MVNVDGTWTMEGLSYSDERRIKSCEELISLINSIGFLPLFKNNVSGFSVEELTASQAWWCGRAEEDPWEWREIIAEQGSIAYGKFFSGKAGFISREWIPLFAAYRRDGYDFDSRYEDGLVNRKAKKIMDVLSRHTEMLSHELKAEAGFYKGGEKGYDSTLTSLQMLTYITVRGFQRKLNKKGEEYGWPAAVYALMEEQFGVEYVRSAYSVAAKTAKELILEHIMTKLNKADYIELKGYMK